MRAKRGRAGTRFRPGTTGAELVKNVSAIAVARDKLTGAA